MKEEELIKKLENVELPEIELQSHRRRLKTALLHANCFKEQPKHRIAELAKSKLKGGMVIMKGGIVTLVRGFSSKKPVWKLAVPAMLAIVILVSLAVMLPPLFGQNDEALAAEIVLNSPEVKNALNDDTIASVRVMQNTGNIVTVEVTGINGTHLDVKVDLSSKTVMEVVVGPPQNFSDDEVEKVILIIQSDDTIKALLEQGAIIKSMSNYYLKMEPAKLGEGAGEIIEKKVHVTIALGDKLYLADIELISGQLLSFGDYDAVKTVPEIQP